MLSNREFAVDIVKTLSDEQIDAFITLFAPPSIQAAVEADKIANDPNRKHYSSFSEMAKDILSDE